MAEEPGGQCFRHKAELSWRILYLLRLCSAGAKSYSKQPRGKVIARNVFVGIWIDERFNAGCCGLAVVGDLLV